MLFVALILLTPARSLRRKLVVCRVPILSVYFGSLLFRSIVIFWSVFFCLSDAGRTHTALTRLGSGRYTPTTQTVDIETRLFCSTNDVLFESIYKGHTHALCIRPKERERELSRAQRGAQSRRPSGRYRLAMRRNLDGSSVSCNEWNTDEFPSSPTLRFDVALPCLVTDLLPERGNEGPIEPVAVA